MFTKTITKRILKAYELSVSVQKHYKLSTHIQYLLMGPVNCLNLPKICNGQCKHFLFDSVRIKQKSLHCPLHILRGHN